MLWIQVIVMKKNKIYFWQWKHKGLRHSSFVFQFFLFLLLMRSLWCGIVTNKVKFTPNCEQRQWKLLMEFRHLQRKVCWNGNKRNFPSIPILLLLLLRFSCLIRFMWKLLPAKAGHFFLTDFLHGISFIICFLECEDFICKERF